MKAQKLAIEYVSVDSLIPYVNNARTHSAEQVSQIVASIKEFGFTNPVLIDGENGLIAGHGRVMAARKMGMQEVPSIQLSHLTEVQKRAYILSDNKLALNAGWDDDLLALELSQLDDLGFDMALIGFTDEELGDLMPSEETAGLTDEDAVPEVKDDPVTSPGDVWIMGKHRVMCGDSTRIDSVEKLMAGEKATLLHADPPYGMGKEGEGVANDNLYSAKLDAFQMEWWATLRTFILNNASVYIWGNAEGLWRLWFQAGLVDLERVTFRNQIVWDKGSGQGMSAESHRMFPTATEHALFFMIGEQGFNNNSENYWDGWEPIRSYLEQEMLKCGWTVKNINEITGTQAGGHWVTKSQWMLITRDHYEAIQSAARDYDAFKRDHDELKRDHDELKREFYSTRAFFNNAHDNMTDVWSFQRVSGADRHGHATPKPVAMMERIMLSSAPNGGLVVEPFGGSGSTLIAAEKTDRRCYTMELQASYCDVIVKRWQSFTGKQATLEGDGRVFDDVAAKRTVAAMPCHA